ncbi:MAG: hypothetical protein ASARMPRED_007149 [Alectoria sarmentosa]|nr:MAG: hypothetical protein ASARMPRED_007149 [Alectoria sarmentosa]
MPPPSSSDVPPFSLQGPIARSRSRYKGPRPHKTSPNPSESPSISAEQLQRMRNVALSRRESRPQSDGEDGRGLKIQPLLRDTTQMYRGSANDAQKPEALVAQKHGSLGEASKRTTLQDEDVSQSQVLRGYQQNSPLRRYDAEAAPRKEADQDTARSRNLATSPEHYHRNPGPDLRYSREEESATTIRSPSCPKRGLTQRIARNSNAKRLRKSKEELKRTISAPIAIEPPQNIAKPAFDAPLSAVNAGERRVKVKYDQNLMSLPVTPATTPLDLVRSAADQLAESIDLKSTVLFESFKQFGLERPLRRYEHVRDVLNSWDNDTHNTLVIKSSPTGGRDDDLDLHFVSSSQPVDTSINIYYSQRPGHWDKRWITLRSDGQMLVAKGEGGETANICHMSDFDIYIPTARQSAKRIRPPRKICFAVKSQQKSSMFLSTANFVHFFSTSNRTLAASWYKAVQEWRSWYLVHVMGQGKEGAQSSRKVSTKAEIQKVASSGFSKSEIQRRPPEPPCQGRSSITASAMANHNTEHIVPFQTSNSKPNVAGESVRGMPFRNRSETQTLQSKKVTKDADMFAPREHGPSFVQAIPQEEPEPFAATGLLGRTYTQRQKAQREREKTGNAALCQPVAPRNISPVYGLNRTLPQRPVPKALIDLTPQYQDPPQHTKKGRGVVLKQIPAGGLVEVANTPEAAITIPPSTLWRRPPSRGRDGPSVGRSKTVRGDHSSGTPSELKQTSMSPEKRDIAFTGGLFARSTRGQGGARTGRGVVTGHRQAKEPMLDVGEESQYAPGSLLERVERKDGNSRPIIEREKRREIIATVVEGV